MMGNWFKELALAKPILRKLRRSAFLRDPSASAFYRRTRQDDDAREQQIEGLVACLKALAGRILVLYGITRNADASQPGHVNRITTQESRALKANRVAAGREHYHGGQDTLPAQRLSVERAQG